jgi:hypothetical protein
MYPPLLSAGPDRLNRPVLPGAHQPLVEQRIVQMRRRERSGRGWIAAELGVPFRAMSRVLVRRRMPARGGLDPLTGEPIRANRASALRHVPDRPGNWSMKFINPAAPGTKAR